MDTLTKEEFKAAADKTKINKDVRKAAGLVILKGAGITDAARRCNGVTKQSVYSAINKIRKVHGEIRTPEGCRLVKDWLPLSQANAVEKRCRLRKMNL